MSKVTGLEEAESRLKTKSDPQVCPVYYYKLQPYDLNAEQSKKCFIY